MIKNTKRDTQSNEPKKVTELTEEELYPVNGARSSDWIVSRVTDFHTHANGRR